jgi:hypothetical protein
MARNGSDISRATGSGAIAKTIAPGVQWQLEEVRLHLSGAGGAENFTITIDAGAGAAYDTVLLTEDMTTVTDLVWKPEDGPILLAANDEVDIAFTNTATRTYGLEVVYTLT